jgi:hypothetical protein
MAIPDQRKFLAYNDMETDRAVLAKYGKSKLSILLEDFAEYKVHQAKSTKVDKMKNALDAVSATWEIVKNTFRSEQKTEALNRFIKLGFDEIDTKTHVTMFRGVPMAKFATLKKFVNLKISCPPEK